MQQRQQWHPGCLAMEDCMVATSCQVSMASWQEGSNRLALLQRQQPPRRRRQQPPVMEAPCSAALAAVISCMVWSSWHSCLLVLGMTMVLLDWVCWHMPLGLWAAVIM
jgi:hypothetical protein